MNPILEVKHIGKRFKLTHDRKPYLSLRESLNNVFSTSSTYEDFWALKDVSFTIEAGESIGVIGKNGAGKSTLLKILSRITPPTEGKIISRGRIASLLEVGTGFHPELTGKENIFFNGSILGMKRKEIIKKFDEIVDFSGVEKFLDTPLKHYSSGMQLRLAFSVAAFLEPEILVIDEVLAVGDAEFQKKCIGKMEDVSKSGRTILFVSHNMSAIESLCSKTILLQNGKVALQSASSEVISSYLNAIDNISDNFSGVINYQNTNQPITKIEILVNGKNTSIGHMGCALEIKVHFAANEYLDMPVLGVIFKDNQNIPILGINNKHYSANLISSAIKKGCLSMTIPYLTLFEGVYHIDIRLGNAFKDIQVLNDCMLLTVDAMQFTATGEMPDKKINKIFIKDVKWQLA